MTENRSFLFLRGDENEGNRISDRLFGIGGNYCCGCGSFADFVAFGGVADFPCGDCGAGICRTFAVGIFEVAEISKADGTGRF